MIYFERLGYADIEFFAVKVFHGRLILGGKRVVQKSLANCTFPNSCVTKHHQSGSLRVGHDIPYGSVSRTRTISLPIRHCAPN